MRWYRAIAFALPVVVWLASNPAQASIFDFTAAFHGNTVDNSRGNRTSPWAIASFTDLSRNVVQMQLVAPGLVGNQRIDQLYFSIAGIDPRALTFTWVSGPKATISLGSDQFQAGGSGRYDIRIQFSGGGISSGQSSVYRISTAPSLFTSGSFNTLSAPNNTKGNVPQFGPFYAAAHMTGSGLGTPWIAVTAPAPEPEIYAMLLLGLAAMPLVTRRRRKSSAT